MFFFSVCVGAGVVAGVVAGIGFGFGLVSGYRTQSFWPTVSGGTVQ